MTLPKDPMMLFSVVNMKLRDEYHSLDALCENMERLQTRIAGATSSCRF